MLFTDPEEPMAIEEYFARVYKDNKSDEIKHTKVRKMSIDTLINTLEG